jgi:hypothetical protein
MIGQLREQMPGFTLGSESLQPGKELRIMIEEGNAAQGEFVIHSMLELLLRNQAKVVFVGA